ncbi:MAG: 2-hydroxychromene-2-carboxylate isomerase [Deltaproteobacteria bacterium]|nr:2-hydroxychromene-2-carboxylate isomerase [Deltaproteobacteria bacterium]MBW2291732.1 2-hydroxychromene-2-carboxylate isomerase [Deltaproteobacteria bacterium]MBW2390579.1 2-hydroxychromene-2-carboxylate isomerase [Deltaproteobacteria bacterium]
MPQKLEYFFDYVSPFSYLADSQLPDLLARTGAEIEYRPFLLGGIMKATGNSPPFTVPAKGRYTAVDTARWATHYGITMGGNEHFPINTVLPMRVALVLQQLGGFEAFHKSIFPAMWGEGANIADPEVLTVLIEKAGANATQVLEQTKTQEIKDALRKNTDEAVERGAFGAPTFFVGDEMFFGNDRLNFVEQALAS